jgi:hypothetical protein
MISKCANPQCETAFHYLRGGKLYCFDLRRPLKPCRDVPNAICEKEHRTRACTSGCAANARSNMRFGFRRIMDSRLFRNRFLMAVRTTKDRFERALRCRTRQPLPAIQRKNDQHWVYRVPEKIGFALHICWLLKGTSNTVERVLFFRTQV